MRIIKVINYQHSWMNDFELEKKLITDAIPEEILFIHHIGSTSVAGLAAKPIIDILIEIKNVVDIDKYNSQFEKIGYECKGEFGIPGRRYFQKGGDNRTHHIHAFNSGSQGAKRHLAFRDYLIAHKQVAKEYEALKFQALKECNNDSSIYCNIKNNFIVYHEKQALKWWNRNA